MKHSLIAIRLLSACVAALGCASAVFAQETRATLIGQVSDPNGGAGAAVSAVNVETNVAMRSNTNEAGNTKSTKEETPKRKVADSCWELLALGLCFLCAPDFGLI